MCPRALVRGVQSEASNIFIGRPGGPNLLGNGVVTERYRRANAVRGRWAYGVQTTARFDPRYEIG